MNASVSPSRVLPGQLQDQLTALSAVARPPSQWSPSIERPLVAHELAMPAEQSLRGNKKGGPSRPRKDPAQGGEEQTVTRLKVRPVELAFEDAELMAEGQNLDPELGLGLPALDEELEEESDEAVQEGKTHGWDHGERGGPAALPNPCPSRASKIP